MEKKIIVCIGTDSQDGLRARLSLLIVDGGAVLSERYHSVAIAPGDDIQRIRSHVEAHLADANGGIPGAPWPAIPDAEWAKVAGCVGVLHTPEVVARHLASIQ